MSIYDAERIFKAAASDPNPKMSVERTTALGLENLSRWLESEIEDIKKSIEKLSSEVRSLKR
jgi:hypothetical protein